MKKLLLITAVLLTASCSHYNQKVKLDFAVDSSKLATTKKTFELKVIDARQNQEILGTKKFGDAKTTIAADQNLAVFLQSKLTENLLKRGYKPGNDKKIEVTIETFEYKANRGGIVGKSSVEVNLQVVVKSWGGKKFNRNFELSVKNKHFIMPLETTDAATINLTLQESVQNILNDDMFLQSLAD